MFSELYRIIGDAGILFGALTFVCLIAFLASVFRGKRSLRSLLAMVVCAALAATLGWVSSTRPHHITTVEIQATALESGHEGIRGNGLLYDTTIHVGVKLHPLPGSNSGVGGAINKVSGWLVNREVTTNGQVVVYSIIKAQPAAHFRATVDHTARAVTLWLPNPTVDQSTTYVSRVGKLSLRQGPLNAGSGSGAVACSG